MASETELLIRLDATTAQLRRELSRGGKQLNKFTQNGERRARRFEKNVSASFANAARSIKSFGAGAVISAASALSFRSLISSIEKVDDVAKTAQFANITVEALQEIRHAGEISGVAIEQTDKALIKFNKSLGELKTRSSSTLGLQLENNQALVEQLKNTDSTTDALELMFDALANTADSSERAALANAAFGRSGQLLANVLRDNAEGFANLRRQAHELGIVIDSETAAKAEVAVDKLTILGSRWSTFWGEVAIGVAGMFTDLELPQEAIDRLNKEMGTLESRITDLKDNGRFFGLSSVDDDDVEIVNARERIEEIKKEIEAEQALIDLKNQKKQIQTGDVEAQRLEKENQVIKQTIDSVNEYIERLEQAANQKELLAEAASISEEVEAEVSKELQVQNALLDASNQLKEKGLELTAQQAQRIREATEAQIEADERQRSMEEERRKDEQDAKQRQREATEAQKEAQDEQDEQIQKARDGWDNIFSRIESGALNSKEAVLELVKELITAQIKAKAVDALSGGFGGGAGGTGGGTGGFNPNSLFSLFHSGGIVGSSKGVKRSVNPAVFANARRYHDGGLVSGEVPAILQRGERVLSRQEVKDGVGTGPSSININIQNNGGGKNVSSVEQTVDVKGAVINILLEDQRDNGPITQGNQTMFGRRGDVV